MKMRILQNIYAKSSSLIEIQKTFSLLHFLDKNRILAREKKIPNSEMSKFKIK